MNVNVFVRLCSGSRPTYNKLSKYSLGMEVIKNSTGHNLTALLNAWLTTGFQQVGRPVGFLNTVPVQASQGSTISESHLGITQAAALTDSWRLLHEIRFVPQCLSQFIFGSAGEAGEGSAQCHHGHHLV